MMKLMKEFWTEEDGFGTVEIIILIVILLGIAFLFRDAIRKFVEKLLNQIFDNTENTLEGEDNTFERKK